MLGNRPHEGLQPPSNLEERKRLKEAQHAAHVLSAARPHPPRTRGVISASLEGSSPKPSTAPCTSASLEGSERALEKADRLRPKELSSRTPGVRLHLTGPTVPDQLPARGRVRCRHVSQRWKCTAPVAEDPGPPRTYPDPRALGSASCSGGVRSRHVSRGRGHRHKPSAGSSLTHPY